MARVRRPFVTFGFTIGRQEYLLALFVLCLFPSRPAATWPVPILTLAGKTFHQAISPTTFVLLALSGTINPAPTVPQSQLQLPNKL